MYRLRNNLDHVEIEILLMWMWKLATVEVKFKLRSNQTKHCNELNDLNCFFSSAKGNTSGVVDVSHSGVADAIHQNDHDRDDEDEDDDGRPKILLMGLRR